MSFDEALEEIITMKDLLLLFLLCLSAILLVTIEILLVYLSNGILLNSHPTQSPLFHSTCFLLSKHSRRKKDVRFLTSLYLVIISRCFEAKLFLLNAESVFLSASKSKISALYCQTPIKDTALPVLFIVTAEECFKKET